MTPAAMRSIWLGLMAFAVILTGCSRPSPRLDGQAYRTVPWSAELVDRIASTPVQADGRIKPLSVLAAFTLYDVHGRRDLKYSVPGPDGVQQKVKLEPVWRGPREPKPRTTRVQNLTFKSRSMPATYNIHALK